MKMKTMFFAFLLSLALCLPTLAEVKDFGNFTGNVPAGWTTFKNNDTGVVGIIAPDKSAAVSIYLDKNPAENIEELAKQFFAALKGSDLKKVQDNTFRFTFKNESGVESKCAISGDSELFCMVTVTGNHPEVENIVNSLQPK